LKCLHCRFIEGDDYNYRNSTDLNAMSYQELENELFELKGEIKLKKLKYEGKLNRKKAEYERQISRYESKLKSTSNESKIQEYELQIEELNTKMEIGLSKLNRSLDSEMREMNQRLKNIKTVIQTNFPEKTNEKTSQRNDIESDASTSSVFTRLSFPSPFRIIS